MANTSRAARASEDVAQGIAILKQAIALEPDFAPAHYELASAYLYVATFGTGEKGTVERASQEIDQALRLDPTLRSALNLRANLAILNWDWAAAKKQLDELIATGPHDYGALLRSGQLARALGHPEQALPYFRECLQLDPLSVLGHVQLVMLLDAMGQPAQARAEAQSVLSINPMTTKVHLLIALMDLKAGDMDAAYSAIEKETGEYYRLEGRSILDYASKRLADSDAALQKLINEYHATAAIQVAQAYAYRGERDKAFEWLDTAFTQKDPGLVNVKTDPLLTILRADLRFGKLLQRMNLPTT